MSVTDSARTPVTPDTVFGARLRAAFRGGVIMLVCSVVWGNALQRFSDPDYHVLIGCVPLAWLVFPIGAALGCWLPQWVAGRGLARAAGVGLVAGLTAALILGLAVWLLRNHLELIGLISNRESPGYASYAESVGMETRADAFRVLTRVVPIAFAWVAAWALWDRRFSAKPTTTPGGAQECRVQLQVNARLLRPVGWLALGLAAVATIDLLVASFRPLTHVPMANFFLIGPGAASLVILGPWLGPLINPGAGRVDVLLFTAVGLSVLLGGIAPFLLRRRVKISTAVAARCGFVTGLLFWIFLGVLSFGRSVG